MILRAWLASLWGPSAAERSTPTASARPPPLRISATTRSASSAPLLKVNQNLGARWASLSALARPSPRDAPVTSAVFPESVVMT